MNKIVFLLVAFFILTVNSTTAQTVYVTKTGKKYHIESCRFLSQSKISIELKDAIARGYGPCSVCKPPTTITPADKQPVSHPSQGIRIGCICKDGTHSSATGRGACSHHGGVDHWLYK